MQPQRARVFGTVAQEYDRVRPSYPPAMFDDILAYARVDGAPVLDVGAGTGRATLALAERGVRVSAVEPDAEMAAILAERVRGLPVDVTVASFESFEPAQPYALLICAQAWHWLDPATRWQRGAAALAPGGALALCWNAEVLGEPLAGHVRAAYAAHVGDRGELPPTPDQVEEFWREFQSQPGFTDQEKRQYHWSRRLPGSDFVATLRTHSAFLILEPAVRDAFFGDLAARLDQEVTVAMTTRLLLARRRPAE
jgi:SAM-dependent methyltransferase